MRAIATNDLTKRFARTASYRDLLPFYKRQFVTAVDNVTLDIKEGEFFGLLGPNGAGKTTFIKLLCCLVLPTSGLARIFGNDVVKKEQEVNKLVGLVNAEERSFFWRLSGRENLQFYASLYQMSSQQAKKRIDELLEMVGLTNEADIRFQNYSTGTRQKLAIVRSFLSHPRVLFADEPTRSLDPISAQAIRRFLKEIVTRNGGTVVLATHNLSEAEQLCDRLAIFEHGRVTAVGSMPELRLRFQTQEEYELKVRHLSEIIVTRLREIDGVSKCQIKEHYDGISILEIEMFNQMTVLPRIMQTIVGGGADVCSCHLKEPSLEEIFTRAVRAGDMKVGIK